MSTSSNGKRAYYTRKVGPFHIYTAFMHGLRKNPIVIFSKNAGKPVYLLHIYTGSGL